MAAVASGMRRGLRVVLSALVAGATAYAAAAALWRPLDVPLQPRGDGFTSIAGVVHVHTTVSDGGGTPEEVVAAAQAAGLQFLFLTDHNTLDAKPVEGYHGRLLVLVGTEVSTTAGHVLGLGIPDPVFRFSGDAEDALEDIRDLGGVSFVAHPTSPLETFRWTDWSRPGPWGLEILNGDTEWRAAGWARQARAIALYGFNPSYALLSSLTAPREALERWDALLRERDAPGLAGADAHSRLVLRRQTALRFPGYEALFRLARNHVLLEAPPSGETSRDAAAVVSALARGRSYMALDALAPAAGFELTIDGDGRRWTMGDTVPASAGLRLRAGGALPRGARVRVLRDGQAIAEAAGEARRQDVPPGVYRVEVRVPHWGTPWIVSNPVYVFDAETAERRRQRAAWPPEPPAPAPAELVDGFEGTTVFEAGADASSAVTGGILDPTGGEDGHGAARLRFRLGLPSAAIPSPFCALVSWKPRDLSGRRGLVFSVKADGVYRFWVQVRDANPASADQGTEWWFASVRTSTAWRRVAVPFSRLRSINPRTDGRLDLDKVRALVFVLDRGAVKPGTAGTIWIDEVGVY